MKLERGTKIDDFFAGLPKDTQECLSSLSAGRNERIFTLNGLGEVKLYRDACSEGADRGGYVNYLELLEVVDYTDKMVVLEGETDESGWMFRGRTTIIF